MSESTYTRRDALVAEIERGWTALNGALDALPAERLSGPRDAAGWTATDHINHLAAWENSIVALLQSRPRHEVLGIDESLFLSRDFDVENDVIRQNMADLSADEARANLRAVHQALLAELAQLTDADLALPYRHYLPDEPRDDDGPTAEAMVRGDTIDHYGEHLAWIEEIIGNYE
jgi:hypothetical protein